MKRRFMRFVLSTLLSWLKKKEQKLVQEQSRAYVCYGKRPFKATTGKLQTSIKEVEELMERYK
jgi:hypothetical protein